MPEIEEETHEIEKKFSYIRDAIEDQYMDKSLKVDVIKQYIKQVEELSIDHGDCDQHYSKSAIVTTLGMVVHSISDGLALGASLFFSRLMQIQVCQQKAGLLKDLPSIDA